MSELGTVLKEARLAKNLSLDDLQEMTKIQKRYLIGIEEGNYSLMPGQFYVRAFIKQYAEAVGMDPEQLFEEYKSEIPNTHSEDIPGQLSRVKTKRSLGENSSKVLDFLPKLLIVAVIIGLFVFIWWYFSKNTGTETDLSEQNENRQEVTYEEREKAANNDSAELDEEEESDNNSPVEEIEEPKETEEPEPATQELTVVETNGSKSTYELKNAEQFVIKVVSTGETWVNIKNGKGHSFFQGMMKKGGPDESKEMNLSEETEVIITAGRSTETEIYVNDQRLEYSVSPTEKVRQDITIRYTKADQ
ncbi:RodZ domain-containing protein [Niallia sp. Krafla_26]|uniref:helix-turn-helix domain-containing protein n=1 Tax=Niallia sp. Krafla_26 TaxID=3064703 RepID=UPI003D1637A9